MKQPTQVTKLKINKTKQTLKSERPKFDQQGGGTASCSICGTCHGTDD